MGRSAKRSRGTAYHKYVLREDEHPGGLLELQTPYGKGRQAHPDESLFIITHQTFELWFKLLLFEILREKTGTVALIQRADFARAAASVRRLTKVVRVLADQYGIIETITPTDFLVFRDVLRPSSGYDSAQFRALELASGLRGDGAYLRHLTGLEAPSGGAAGFAKRLDAVIRATEEGAEIPLKEYSIVRKAALAGDVNGLKLLRRVLAGDSLRDAAYAAVLQADVRVAAWKDKAVRGWLKARVKEWTAEQSASKRAGHAHDLGMDGETAAHIQLHLAALYRGATDGGWGHSPQRGLLDLVEALIEYDEVFRNLRAIHINMVMRVIGGKPGTGGSSGASYLRTTLDYEFFPLLWRARDHMEGP